MLFELRFWNVVTVLTNDLVKESFTLLNSKPPLQSLIYCVLLLFLDFIFKVFLFCFDLRDQNLVYDY